MPYGKQIRLFLTDGDATGVRYAELVNWTGQAFSLPWVSRASLKTWGETFRPGVYVLFGLDDAGDDIAYIGESENVFQRLATHASSPPLSEITSVVLFTSKDDNLTKGHVVFLERKLVDRAELAKRRKVQFGKMPSEKVLPKPEVATMDEFLDNIYLVSSALGHDIFELPKLPTRTPDTGPMGDNAFEMSMHDGLAAKAYRSENGFVVLKGSHAKAGETDTLGDSYRSLRDDLKEKGVLVEREGRLAFSQDYAFKSSSAAAAVVSGSQRSGPQTWLRPSDGMLLKDVEAAEAESDVAESLGPDLP